MTSPEDDKKVNSKDKQFIYKANDNKNNKIFKSNNSIWSNIFDKSKNDIKNCEIIKVKDSKVLNLND